MFDLRNPDRIVYSGTVYACFSDCQNR